MRWVQFQFIQISFFITLRQMFYGKLFKIELLVDDYFQNNLHYY